MTRFYFYASLDNTVHEKVIFAFSESTLLLPNMYFHQA